MAATKPKKPRSGSRAKHGKGIPRGDDFLPGVDTSVLRTMHKELSGRKDVGKEIHILAAAIKWREGFGVSGNGKANDTAPLHRKRLAGAAARPRA